jgi:hypothetical protein
MSAVWRIETMGSRLLFMSEEALDRTGAPGGAKAGGVVSQRVLVTDGVCRVFFAYDIGFSIKLEEAQRLIGAEGQRKVVALRRRTPEHFGYQRPPLRVSDEAPRIAIGGNEAGRAGWTTETQVECVIFEFGAVSLRYTIPLAGAGQGGEGREGLALAELVRLSDALYQNAALLADSKRRVEELLGQIRAAVKKPMISPLVEDYSVFELHRVMCPGDVASVLLAAGPLVASILRSEPGLLSSEEIHDAVSNRISYTPDDLTLIDWNGALVVGAGMDDVIAVLEYANVELLEMRFLDGELDRALEQSHARQPARGWRKLLGLGPSIGGESPLQRIAELQVDAATLFEEVNNSFKMLGDQYLARVYRLASQRLHLPEWDASILRKLNTLESLYEKLHDFETTRRLELLEWIVIILIAFEVIMSFLRH